MRASFIGALLLLTLRSSGAARLRAAGGSAAGGSAAGGGSVLQARTLYSQKEIDARTCATLGWEGLGTGLGCTCADLLKTVPDTLFSMDPSDHADACYAAWQDPPPTPSPTTAEEVGRLAYAKRVAKNSKTVTDAVKTIAELGAFALSPALGTVVMIGATILTDLAAKTSTSTGNDAGCNGACLWAEVHAASESYTDDKIGMNNYDLEINKIQGFAKTAREITLTFETDCAAYVSTSSPTPSPSTTKGHHFLPWRYGGLLSLSQNTSGGDADWGLSCLELGQSARSAIGTTTADIANECSCESEAGLSAASNGFEALLIEMEVNEATLWGDSASFTEKALQNTNYKFSVLAPTYGMLEINTNIVYLIMSVASAAKAGPQCGTVPGAYRKLLKLVTNYNKWVVKWPEKVLQERMSNINVVSTDGTGGSCCTVNNGQTSFTDGSCANFNLKCASGFNADGVPGNEAKRKLYGPFPSQKSDGPGVDCCPNHTVGYMEIEDNVPTRTCKATYEYTLHGAWNSHAGEQTTECYNHYYHTVHLLQTDSSRSQHRVATSLGDCGLNASVSYDNCPDVKTKLELIVYEYKIKVWRDTVQWLNQNIVKTARRWTEAVNQLQNAPYNDCMENITDIPTLPLTLAGVNCIDQNQLCNSDADSKANWPNEEDQSKWRRLLDSNCDATCMKDMIKKGDLDTIRYWLAAADPDRVNTRSTDGHSPLSWAYESGREDVIELLVSAGARDELDDDNGWQGVTPTMIYYMIKANDIESIKAFAVGNGHKSMRSDDGRGPLWWAYEFGREVIITLLLNAGFSDEVVDNTGKTPSEMKPTN